MSSVFLFLSLDDLAQFLPLPLLLLHFGVERLLSIFSFIDIMYATKEVESQQESMSPFLLNGTDCN
jgi:hypothetical protein